MRWPHRWKSSAQCRPVIFLIVIALLFLILAASPVAAMQAGDDPAFAQGPVLMANWIGTAIGDRTRWIQVGCVVAAAAIFVLTRSIK